jgi:hypothetical protein
MFGLRNGLLWVGPACEYPNIQLFLWINLIICFISNAMDQPILKPNWIYNNHTFFKLNPEKLGMLQF